PVFHTIVSIKNDGHYFCRAGGNRPDGLNEPVTVFLSLTIILLDIHPMKLPQSWWWELKLRREGVNN
ncbi:hypothetical protein, partial [Escherichia coli]